MTGFRCTAVLQALVAQDKDMSASALVKATNRTRDDITNCIQLLKRRGLAEIPRKGFYAATDAGRSLIGRGGKITSGPAGPLTGARRPRSKTLQGRAWTALRSAESPMTVADIVEIASTGEERDPYNTIQKYVRALKVAGYLMEMARREPGTRIGSNGWKRYRLVPAMNSGPRHPVLNTGRKTLGDRNTDRICDLTTGEWRDRREARP